MLSMMMLGVAGVTPETGPSTVDGARALAEVRRAVHRFRYDEKGPNGQERVIALVGGALGLGEVEFRGHSSPRFAGVAKRPMQDAIGQIDREYWDKYELVRSVRFETRETVTVTLPFDFDDWYESAPHRRRYEYDHLRTRCERERYRDRLAKTWKQRVQFPWVTIEVETAWDSTWPGNAQLDKPYAFTAEFKHCYVLYGKHSGHGFYEWDPNIPPAPRLVIVMSVKEAGEPETQVGEATASATPW